MRKNIGFVGLDSAALSRIIEKLKSVPSDLAYTAELTAALKNLSNGQIQTLMIERTDGGAAASGAEIICGELKIYPFKRRVTRSGEDIILTPKEFDILLFLAKNRGEIFTKEQIYRAVWDAEYLTDDSNIMAFIRKLRKKNRAAPRHARLHTNNLGYRL
ncbi:MAG: winged helix-turn-helix domain-containing protein [Oscillospiraceae bacterium]|nr:winged helix-turn-helix domain-containing protein [Oscillospiraceae bacterium]